MSITNNINDKLSLNNLEIKYRHTNVPLDYYKEMISWGQFGFKHMNRKCNETVWCREKYRIIAQGMGLLGNALVSYSFAYHGHKIVPEPIVYHKINDCIIKSGSIYDVGVLIHGNKYEFILLLEVKLYKKTSENLPSFKNVDYVYMEIPKAKYILEKCRAVPLGILLELNKPPKNVRIPPHILEIRGINGKKACERIYNGVLNWCSKRNIL